MRGFRAKSSSHGKARHVTPCAPVQNRRAADCPPCQNPVHLEKKPAPAPPAFNKCRRNGRKFPNGSPPARKWNSRNKRKLSPKLFRPRSPISWREPKKFGVNSRRASRLVNWFLKRVEANRDVFGHGLFRQTLLPGSRQRSRSHRARAGNSP